MPLGDKPQLEVVYDAVHHRIVRDEGDDLHLSATLWADEGETSWTLRIISGQPEMKHGPIALIDEKMSTSPAT
jgi:hypothetical protein